MRSRKLRLALIVMAVALMSTLVVGCAASVPLEEYEAVTADRDALKAKVTSLQTELTAAKAEIEALKAEPTPQPSILPTVSIYDEEDLLEISIEDFAKYHGDICLCGTIGFRLTQLAISQLWGNEIPARGDFKIISACPTRGSKDCIEFVTRVITRKKGADFELELPEGTDIENLTTENFSFTFIRKSTGGSVTVRVKEEVFPPGFFEMRKKVKFEGTATPEEKKAFKSAYAKLLNGALSLPTDEFLECEKD